MELSFARSTISCWLGRLPGQRRMLHQRQQFGRFYWWRPPVRIPAGPSGNWHRSGGTCCGPEGKRDHIVSIQTHARMAKWPYGCWSFSAPIWSRHSCLWFGKKLPTVGQNFSLLITTVIPKMLGYNLKCELIRPQHTFLLTRDDLCSQMTVFWSVPEPM